MTPTKTVAQQGKQGQGDLGERGAVIGPCDVLGQTELNELRIQVAELNGWERGRTVCVGGEAWMVWHKGSRVGSIKTHTLPNYPLDLNACAELIDLLAGRGWNCALGNGLDKTWECEFYRPAKLGRAHPDNLGIRDGKSVELHYGSADTMPLAICDAFVRTMEAPSAEQDGNEVR